MMEDSGIDSDSKSNCNGSRTSVSGGGPILCHEHCKKIDAVSEEGHLSKEAGGLKDGHFDKENSTGKQCEVVCNLSGTSSTSNNSPTSPPPQLISSAQLQKRLEKQIQEAKKIRQKAQSGVVDSQPKKSLIPRSRLKVPIKSSVPVVTKADEHPLVTWESDSEDEFEFHPMSKSTVREITRQLIKDGYNLDLTPDDEDLDLIPPKPLKKQCMCCSVNYLCTIQ